MQNEPSEEVGQREGERESEIEIRICRVEDEREEKK
jgi:hypothetical protein